MRTLAIDFSSPQRSVAVLESRAGHGTDGQFEFEAIETGQGTQAFTNIRDLLDRAGLGVRQIERVVVGLGPGSYTGIRSAIAIAQGWQCAHPVQLFGVSSALCIAAQAAAEEVSGDVAVVIDAQRGEFYHAAYRLSGEGCREVSPLRLCSLDQIRSWQGSGVKWVGPEVTRWFPEGRVIFPRAQRLAELAPAGQAGVAGECLEPIYLRQPAFVKAPPPRRLDFT